MDVFNKRMIQALRDEVAALTRERDAAQQSLLFMASRIGQFEQQRNHARWKLGRAKRRHRERAKKFETEIAFLQRLNFERLRTLTPDQLRAAGAAYTAMVTQK